MDNFAEQLVKKHLASSDQFRKVAILVGGIFIALILAIISFMNIGNIFSIIGLLLAAVAGYFTFYLIQGMDVEYEYTFTNGELDIDKIIAKKRRKELITIDVRKIKDFGKYDENASENGDAAIVLSSDNIASHEYFADFEHEEYGKTRLIFSPDERMLENICRMLPGNLRNKLMS